MPPKGKAKGKEIATHKRRASTHDFRKVSTTVENARGSSKFRAVIKFSAGSCKDTPAWEIAEVVTTNKQPTEEGESSLALDDSPAQSAIGLLKDVGGSPAGTLTIVSKSNLSGRPVADSEQGTSGGSPLVTSISKGNVESATPRPQESGTMYKYPRNGLMQKGENATRRNRSITQFTGVLQEMVESAGNRMKYITVFKEPFPDAQQTEDMLDKVWRNSEREHVNDYARDSKIDAYVSRKRLHRLQE